MHARHSITDLFSTFLQFESNVATCWSVDAKLQRSIKQQIQNRPEAEPAFWERFWHQCAQAEAEEPRSLAIGHLSAYLQEACYWSVQKVIQSQRASQIADFFQIAIASVPKILKACEVSGRATLKTYASTAFGNVVRDWLRQRREIDLCNEWGLLLKLSRKRLIEVLQQEGLSRMRIDQLVLAWQCFEASYKPAKTPGLRRSTAPDSETWQVMVDRYNHARSPEWTMTTAVELERWLLYCASRVRNSLYPSVASLNAPRGDRESSELQDNLVNDSNSLLETLIVEEENQQRQTQHSEIAQVLVDGIASLDATTQKLLALYYQQQLTQQQIAKQLEIQQYTVSRKLTKTRETLLLKLVRWSQDLHISVSSNVINVMGAELDEWLQHYYANHDSSDRPSNQASEQ
ncbi:group 3/4 sigma-70 RNA polymerase sigma factor [Phormidesmis priestleyi ULC007]|uniref:Group 3/4 sigma-70 RNA polymerase sigma factor n=1 Tax=Phormidesmis priestleyi ULC007 TaxID=1920490 RepID=A0A2T1D9B2_9CYAN|nr:sigma-70 family RNA polymerase sigma factor [Phormidesmis priestleyi]PSB17047.1 group 3/4 sigma-70 RNA polymerase sigma factor [Phormidesmis priestleyi ULC007]PZO48141.1 MAG: group 3/4 sigma-70 RNA polymerase sigma factor [Phormidesmis priestleyi]